jgi:hypothetical protein
LLGAGHLPILLVITMLSSVFAAALFMPYVYWQQ